MARFIFLIAIVILSTIGLYLLHIFAPNLNESETARADFRFPNSLEELQKVAGILKLYSVNHWWYVFLIFSSAYLYKQAFCVPGSLFLNLLAGALYGRILGLFLACLFTAVGGSLCYFLSYTFAKDIVFKYFLRRFLTFQKKVKENENDLFYFMLFIRLVPVAPGWVINVVSPLVGVPPLLFFFTTFIGFCPYNFVGVSAGVMLSSLKSVDDIFTWNVFLSITAIALIAGGPVYILKKRSKQKKIKIA